jgi:hypothetical protein
MNTETKPKKKMGRPPKPGGPLSNRERQQRWRDRVKREADLLLLIVSAEKGARQ